MAKTKACGKMKCTFNPRCTVDCRLFPPCFKDPWQVAFCLLCSFLGIDSGFIQLLCLCSDHFEMSVFVNSLYPFQAKGWCGLSDEEEVEYEVSACIHMTSKMTPEESLSTGLLIPVLQIESTCNFAAVDTHLVSSAICNLHRMMQP